MVFDPKIVGYEPSQTELNHLALVAPRATISLIEDGDVRENGRVVVPDHVRGLGGAAVQNLEVSP